MFLRFAMRIPIFVRMVGKSRFRRDIASTMPAHVTNLRISSIGNRSLLIFFDFVPPLFRGGFPDDWENYFDSDPTPAMLELYSRITQSELNVAEIFLRKQNQRSVWLLLDESGNRGAIYYPAAI